MPKKAVPPAPSPAREPASPPPTASSVLESAVPAAAGPAAEEERPASVSKDAALRPPSPPRRSLRGRLWSRPKATAEGVAALMDKGVSEILANILSARGLDPEDGKDFLEPTLRALLPDPSGFLGMDEAVARARAAVVHGEKIAVFGDYDVDGATSTAIAVRYLRMLATEARIYIPDRIEEGYGPNAPAFDLLKAEGATFVICVDSGTSAFAPLRHAASIGLDVVVLDHHEAEDRLPDAVAVVNPKRRDQTPGYEYFCAAAMSFLFCVGLDRACREDAFYKKLPAKPDLLSLLDLVGLGTVCDVVPLLGANRAFVRRGLELMTRRTNPGIAALAKIAKVKEDATARTCGYALGPRVNAGGRVGRSDTGARLLSSDDPAECEALAGLLDGWNHERRAIEGACVEEAKAQVSARLGPEEKLAGLAFAVGESWHEGVIGIVASRLKDAFDAPSIVFSVKDGVAKGSGRSLDGFDLGRSVIRARSCCVCSSCSKPFDVPKELLDASDAAPIPPEALFDVPEDALDASAPSSVRISCPFCGADADPADRLLIRGGGHAMAAGVTLRADRLPLFEAFLNERLAESNLSESGIVMRTDIVLPPDRVDLGLIDELARLEPMGAGNPTPLVLIPDALIVEVRRLGETTLALDIDAGSGRRLRAKIFKFPGTPLGEALLANARGSRVDLLGTLRVDDWLGSRKAEMVVEDARIRPSKDAP